MLLLRVFHDFLKGSPVSIVGQKEKATADRGLRSW
jgi:hypothetical protein